MYYIRRSFFLLLSFTLSLSHACGFFLFLHLLLWLFLGSIVAFPYDLSIECVFFSALSLFLPLSRSFANACVQSEWLFFSLLFSYYSFSQHFWSVVQVLRHHPHHICIFSFLLCFFGSFSSHSSFRFISFHLIWHIIVCFLSISSF